MPRKPVQEFYSSIVKLSGFGIGGILNMSGKKAGKIGNHAPSTEEIELYLRTFLEEAGIGVVDHWKNEENRVKIYIKGSVFAEGQEGKKPVCIPLQGALSGIFEELTDLKWECKEVECVAQGKEFCLFELEVKG